MRHANKSHIIAKRAWPARLADHRISYSDAVSFAVMRARRCCTVLGFDRDLTIAGFTLWNEG